MTPMMPDRETASRELLHFTEHGAGPPLVLVHGALVTGEMFAPIIGRLAERHRVIVPDLRGHGGSRHLPPPYTATQLATDLARLLDHLGIESAAVLGYSQGGAIAQQLALDHPARCNRLVLAATFAFNLVTLREKLEVRLSLLMIRALGLRRFAKFAVAMALEKLGPERSQWFARLIAEQDQETMLATLRETMMRFDSRRRLGELRCPTLVIAGARDNAVPMRHAEMLRRGIAGAQLVVIDGAGHEFLFTHTAELARATEDFLAGGAIAAAPSAA